MSIYEYESKAKPAALLKYDAGAGAGTCIFSRYFCEDADGDYTLPNFLPNGAVVPLLVGHEWRSVPVGKGTIRSERDGGYFDFTLADTTRGRELGAWLRHDYADGQPKSEFSYGFKILDGGSAYETINGKRLRVLKGRDDGSPGASVMEVSYCLKGAGVGTALVSMKAEQQSHWDRAYAKVRAQIAERRQGEQAEARALYGRWLARQEAITWRGTR